ncbi:CD63 antigen-like [Patella vulgata]|uniref:CD63 antigen-like n=1 Tax=Patella vulgata TaxID=6465 RepID=UPI0024A809D1|nr:CD63 antigen-like [Patella vulgata]
MVEGGGMKCIKFIIFAFNFIFVLVACGLIGLGIYIQVQLSEFFDFFGNQFAGPGIVLIVIGFVIFIVATFGCCGALKENYCCIMTFAVLLGVIFIIQIAAGISGFVLRESMRDQVVVILKGAEHNYGKDGKGGVTKAWDKLQQKFECCGVENYTEWYSLLTPKLVPTSCCVDPKSTECANRTQTLNETEFYTQSCEEGFVGWLDYEIALVGGVGIGLAFVEVVGIILACCLAMAIRKEYKVL